MNQLNWQVQASHFDNSSPIVPAIDVLRRSGFRFQYSLKDAFIKTAFDQMEIKPTEKVLEGGCGLGLLLDRLGSSYGIDAFGVDVSRKSLEKAKKEEVTHLKLSRADVKALPIACETFDHVVSLDVLEHVIDPTIAVSEFARVLKPGGKLLIYAVSRNNRLTFNWLLHRVLQRFGIDPDVRTCHSPELLVNPDEIHSCMESVGCVVQEKKLFHAFFTILFDQLLLSIFWVWSRIAEIKRAGFYIHPPGSKAMAASTWLSNSLIRLLTTIDRPWITRGVSNGFLIIATKPTNGTKLPNMHYRDDGSGNCGSME